MAITLSTSLLQEVFIELSLRNKSCQGKPEYYGIEVTQLRKKPIEFDLALRFKAGERYCCFEHSCHLWLSGKKSWRRVRNSLRARGFRTLPYLTIRKLTVRVEKGAIGTVLKAVGLNEITQRSCEYVDGPIKEEDAQ